MADVRSLHVVSEAVIRLLQASYDPADFNNELEFRVFTSRDFTNPMANGVSLFLYRIFPNGVARMPPGRRGPNGERLQTQLPVELHFLLTVWGGEASLQHTLAGWMMRTLEDSPVLPAAVLNAIVPESFRADESVEISLAELRTEDLLRIWEVLGLNVYQLSVPYVARIINIESRRTLTEGEIPIQERRLRMASVEPPAAMT